MKANDRKSVELLVKSIIEKDLKMIHVKDSALVPYYVHNTKHMIEVEPDDKADLRYCSSKPGNNYSDDFNYNKEQQLSWARALGANYIFVSNSYYGSQLFSIMTPFMIISDKEEEFLLKNFYKDVPENVSEAAKSLKIPLYDKGYSDYIKAKGDRDFSELFYTYSAQFLEFVTNLPYEEQNIEFNKVLIKIIPINFDLISLMTREYSKGKYFKEYFEALNSYRDPKDVVEAIKGLERKPDHDIFLLKKGHIMGEDSAMALYKDDAKAFINYFQKLSGGSMKMVIEKIYDEPFVNQEVVDWLNKNHNDLLREVGFSGGKQDGRI